MVEADHFYDEYELSNHELLELRGRLAMQLAEMREQYGDLLPSPDSLGHLRVIVAYDN